ncbi:uncharacterized protein LOC141851448 [Brevipalpus obovatus]|uniref:uncharacterized protein LOC141851448 n=1 Tax=Brevipalpus obovatus TaxID=246614 RepID=UPI003D9DCF8F
MPKFQLIALFITLIGVASGFRWCDEMRTKLTVSNDKMEIIWIIEDLLNYLVARRVYGRFVKVRGSLNLLISADKTVKEAMKNAKEIVHVSLEDCDTISEQWKMEIQKKLLKARYKSDLLNVMEKIVQFLEIHGAPKAAALARKEMISIWSYIPFSDAKNLTLSQIQRLY